MQPSHERMATVALLGERNAGGGTQSRGRVKRTVAAAGGTAGVFSAAAEAAPHQVAIDYEPALVEAVVTAYVAKPDCPPELGPRAFHRRADRLYALPVAMRERRFRELFADWFARAGFPELLNEALAEFPDVTGRIGRVLVVRAAGRADERADLSNVAAEFEMPPATWLGIRVEPLRFFDTGARQWLRHEIWHVRDMLDPAFHYERGALAAPASRLPERLIQDRYRVLWSLSIDARAELAGALPYHTPEARLGALARLLPHSPEAARRAAFESIGTSRGLSHPDLLDLARRPWQLLRDCDAAAQTPSLGSPCPLCSFATHDWMPPAAVKPDVARAIRARSPEWAVSQGICRTCYDRFELAAK